MKRPSLRFLSFILSLLLLFSSCRIYQEREDETIFDSTLSSSFETSEEGNTEPSDTSDFILGSFPEAELPAYTLTASEVEAAKRMIVYCEAVSLDDTPLADVEDAWEALDEMLYVLQEQVTIANLLYYADMTDPVASNRYSEAVSMIGELEALYYAACRKVYSDAPADKRDALFAEWSEKELHMLACYTAEVTEIEESNLALCMEQQTLPELHFDEATAVLYARFVADYNRLAEIYGYESYYEYATENVYFRDYGKSEREAFRQAVAEYMVPALALLTEHLTEDLQTLNDDEKELLEDLLLADYTALDPNYLINYFMTYDGAMREGLLHALRNGNAYFTSEEGAFAGAFQIDRPATGEPFCYFGPGYQDAFTVAHEIGHYYATLCAKDDIETMDLMEMHSQTNEMLLLAHLSSVLPENVYRALRNYRMLDFLSVILLATIVDEFEETVYSLDDTDGFESEDFDAIMEAVCANYGGYHALRNTLTDMKAYWRLVVMQSPVYYISYATSGSAAIEFLRLAELDEADARERYRKLIEETSSEDCFLGALAKAGMESPFEEYFLLGIRRTMVGENVTLGANAA